METCQRCQSVLPRTAHLCQVCGTPVGLGAPGDPRSAATRRSNEPSRPATIDAETFLRDLLDEPSLDWQEAGWDETSHDAMHPRRTGHDGARPRTESDSYSPVPESTMSNPIEELPTRAVPAFSNRVDADICIGPHENHRLVSIGSAVLALLMFSISTAAMLFTETGSNAHTASATVGQGAKDELAYAEDPETVLRSLTPALVQVTVTGCNGVPTFYGGAMVTRSDTVIVPLPANPESAQVMVSTAAGEVIGSVAGWGLNERMALIRLPSSPAIDPLVWGSANNLADDGELTLIALQAGIWAAGPARVGTIVRNRDGVYSNVNLSDGTLIDGAFVISEGNLVGMVKPSEATSIVTADILRSAVGRMLLDQSWTPEPCPVDPATSTTAAAQTGG